MESVDWYVIEGSHPFESANNKVIDNNLYIISGSYYPPVTVINYSSIFIKGKYHTLDEAIASIPEGQSYKIYDMECEKCHNLEAHWCKYPMIGVS